jgi:exodeoxyribonuclease III
MKPLIASDATFIMADDYNVMSTDLDIYAPERWRDEALFRPEVRKAYAEFVKLGLKDALRHLYPGKRIYTSWKMLYGDYLLGVTETRQPRRHSRRL